MNAHQMQVNNQSRFYGAPATKWLLIVNIAIFLLDIVGAGYDKLGNIAPYGAYIINLAFDHLQLWRLLTFQFLHGDQFHLFFNMFALYMFGRIVEQVMGSRRFITYYLLCGVAGALFYTLLVLLGWLDSGILVGASAGIFGILVALVVIAPDMRVMLLFPPIPMKMKTMGMLMLGIAVVFVIFDLDNAGGEAGHLGGMILGFILMKNPSWLNWADSIGSQQQVVRRPSMQYQAKIRPRTHVNFESSEVDRILDKVSKEGIHSLTDEERETLKRVSESDE